MTDHFAGAAAVAADLIDPAPSPYGALVWAVAGRRLFERQDAGDAVLTVEGDGTTLVYRLAGVDAGSLR
jgi:hypothetical protein